MITVMGATGRIGMKITEQLLKGGEHVRALGRSRSRLSVLEHAGAEVPVGEPSDAAYLTSAFRGADAVYTLLPYDVWSPGYLANQARTGEAIVEAVQASGVRHVVFVSSLGADLMSDTGPVASLYAQEQRLRRIEGVNVLILRAGSFFENFHGALGVIKHEGVHCDALVPDLPIPMIATRDIADAAARALVSRAFRGVVVRELLGPRDLTYAEVTRILGERIGRPDLAYVQLPYGEMARALVGAGFAADLADLYVALARAINEGRVKSQGRTPETTTPTRFEDVAHDLAQAYHALAA